MSTVLITGAQGFLGRNLVTSLSKFGHSFKSFTGDINNLADIRDCIQNTSNLDVVIHLAGISSPSKCLEDKDLSLQVNTKAPQNLAEIVHSKFPNCLFIFPSTGQVYQSNLANLAAPLTENSTLEPINFYAETKLLAEQRLQAVHQKLGLNIVTFRLFNHTHRSQDKNFFLPSLYCQITEGSKHITTGNLNLIRDFGSIQDLISAFRVTIENYPRSGFQTYNLCSGIGKKLEFMAIELASQMQSQVTWRVDKSLIRPNEPYSIVGSCEHFMAQYNWRPKFASSESELVRSFLTDI